ncbi:MAG: xanthine dehydrogenase family protein molybdopterin-binding subunit [Proteobacteria bacterium]|nr:xanthine dehydrogenase family protein molybdopterin-binding subunit [Pseudomonadota bacterium]
MSADHASEHASRTIRVEDDALVRGLGRFIDDVREAGQGFAAFVRSPHAHARIRGIATERARTASGVVCVLTAADMQASGVVSITRHPPMVGRGGSKLVLPPRPPLADERVMHVGQPVALVVAASATQAQDAAELVAVDYEELASVTDLAAASTEAAPLLWPQAPGNLALDWPGPAADADANARAVEAIIQSAAHVARVTVTHQRLAVASIEPRGATASYDAATGNYTIRVCSQGVSTMRENIIAALGVPREKLRVITEDVGGAFGMKTPAYPEYLALLVAAKIAGRSVHWMSTRSEAFVSDNQARESIAQAELALDDKGKFLALRIRHHANLGAFVAPAGAHLNTNNFARCLPGMYRIAPIDVSARCMFSNTVPIGPYRGAGRPELNYVLERVVDEAARVTGIDAAKLRRRNLLHKSAMPHKTPVGTVYDSGDFPAVFDKALELADYAGFAKRRRDARKRGLHRGVGISCMLEHSGALPGEGAALVFSDDGILTVALGVGSTGQGHATVYARLAAARLGIAADKVRVRQGDSQLEVVSNASVGSRSTMAVGSAIVHGVDTLLAKGRAIAAHVLEAAQADLSFADGAFMVSGTDRGISLFDLAARARGLKAKGEIAEDLDTKVTTDTPQTFPNGCHVAEVEIDPATGAVAVVGYTAVDDCGVVIDHTLVEGQLHGGVAQGLGQVLFENVVYDAASGQIMSGSFMDYAMPRADSMPDIVGAEVNARATTNPLGVKGVGEAGTTGSLAAIMNAIADAVPGGAGARLDMPASAEKVWAACRNA